MRFLADQDIYKITIDQLRAWGHEVITAREVGMHDASDEDLLKRARNEARLLITRDKGFGALAFLDKKLSAGVILLKITPTNVKEVHQEIRRLLEEHREEDLRNLFCVIEPHRHRIRRL